MDESPIIQYYRKRAEQSGETYGPPELQKDFVWITEWLHQNVAGCDVLEVASGTGHWSQVVATSARSLVVSDISWNLVHEARRTTNLPRVDFIVADAFTLPVIFNNFNCGMAHFFLSHLRRTEVRLFVANFAQCMKSGSRLLFTDTKWVDGYRKPPLRQDKDGNTYDLRTLKDGSRFEILKNYFTRAEWEQYLAPCGTVYIEELSYVWAIRLELNPLTEHTSPGF
jgi:demethylmenaquinone methyltransferase/2-methoxy-6-polyprenyl-1,4-benzoquinol methylase